MGCEWSEREVSGSRVKPTVHATVHINYEFSIPGSACQRDGNAKVVRADENVVGEK
jgi:hypothetical protein